MFLAYQADLTPHEQEFLDLILSPEGQKIIDEQETVNLDSGWRLVEKFEYFLDTDSISNYGSMMAAVKERAGN